MKSKRQSYGKTRRVLAQYPTFDSTLGGAHKRCKFKKNNLFLLNEDAFREPLSKTHVFKHEVLFFQKKIFFKKIRQQKRVFMVEKGKQKLLFENCKCFSKKK